MSRLVTTVAVASLSAVTLLATACKKDGDKPGPAAEKAADRGAAKAPPAPPAPSGPFAAWDMAARRAAFDGAFVTPGGSLGSWEAWDLHGTKATVYDGKADKELELAVLSPCEVKLTEHLPDGSSSGMVAHYTLQDGALITGLGDAGARKGKAAIACISNTVFELDEAGTCTEWKADMFEDGKYKAAPATCGWQTEGDQELFVATVHGSESKLQVHGDALMTDQLARVHAEKVADFAAAKAARDQK
ncbi:MAG: hypothetical protein H6709_24080 [Kofleriaceae bacterium]|nr:hypothetical protein [Myxococcales bacterium]MCB9560663.1 hypothetical protein [Kofleriaceae bacterium]MCB9575167.1 hypothetical protein [Kofleriaceae bacterium]